MYFISPESPRLLGVDRVYVFSDSQFGLCACQKSLARKNQTSASASQSSPVKLFSVPTGQSGNSPAFQRRVSAVTVTSPKGTAERTALVSASSHYLFYMIRSSLRDLQPLWIEPGIEMPAIVTTSLCDGERDVPVAVFGVAPKTINKPICPTMVRARRPNLPARRVRSLHSVPKKRQKNWTKKD